MKISVKKISILFEPIEIVIRIYNEEDFEKLVEFLECGTKGILPSAEGREKGLFILDNLKLKA